MLLGAAEARSYRAIESCRAAARRTTTRWPRTHVMKPTSASARNVPSISVERSPTDHMFAGTCSSARQASHGSENEVAADVSQTICRSRVACLLS